jgi:hypothetical protein
MENNIKHLPIGATIIRKNDRRQFRVMDTTTEVVLYDEEIGEKVILDEKDYSKINPFLGRGRICYYWLGDF